MAAKIASPSGGSRFVVEQNSDINVTPFVDIMLVLLIIFMVSIPTATVSIRLDLPPPNPSSTRPPREPIVVSVQESGAVFVGQQLVTTQTLAGELVRQIGGSNPQGERTLIRADPNVRYNDFMGVLNALQGGGFFQIALISEDFTNR